MHNDLKARMQSGQPIRILSLDGGGMRGIIPATFLEALEHESGQSIPELFDVVVGTSTGAILSAGLTVAGEDGKAKYNATDFVKLYQGMGKTIFHKDRCLLEILEGITRPSYDPAGYEKLLCDYFADAKLSDALCEVAVPSIELENMKMHIFSQTRASADGKQDYYIKDIIRAATAAPAYFPAKKLANVAGQVRGTFVDAGVSSNNPGVMALAEAKALVGDCQCIFVSLGTGTISAPISSLQAKKWGDAEWLGHIFDLQGDAQSSYTEEAVITFLQHDEQNIYHRFQIDLHTMPYKLDDTTPAHIENLRQAAQTMVQQQGKHIQALTRKLMV